MLTQEMENTRILKRKAEERDQFERAYRENLQTAATASAKAREWEGLYRQSEMRRQEQLRALSDKFNKLAQWVEVLVKGLQMPPELEARTLEDFHKEISRLS